MGSSNLSDPQTDGTILATASYDQTIRVWDVSKTVHSGSISHSEGQVNSMSLTSNARQLAVGSWQKIRVYDLGAGLPKDPIATFDNLFKNVTSIGFEMHGRWMFAGGDDMFCRVFEMRGNQLICQRIFDKSQSSITSIEIATNQVDLFIANASGDVFRWDLRRDDYERLPVPVMGTQECIQKLSVHPSGQKMAGMTNKGRLVHWDLKTQSLHDRPLECSAALNGDPISFLNNYGLSCRYSPNGEHIALCGSDTEAVALHADDFSRRTPLNFGSVWNWDCAFSCDSRHMFSAGGDFKLRIWDTTTWERVAEIDGHTKPVTALCSNARY
ncbi:unnamed protein product [Caenorhabditis auriculariae]|uniref:Target of rapamycin complex subunit lst8 n=1 Tax=Caenorhabditis auriculariae TaxID=2777116 RepID=A0A8S1HPW9_9PELO|nr:unnamed protein product [Caenorhabditis auriculariae]